MTIPKWVTAKAEKMFGPKATASKGRCGHFSQQRDGRPPGCSGIGTHVFPCRGGVPLYQIGRIELGLFNAIKGSGMTWREAFARADLQKHGDGCMRCIRRRTCKTARLLREKADKLRDQRAQELGIWASMNYMA